MTTTNAPRRDQNDRHVLYDQRMPAQILSGDLPDETAGVFLREAEVVLCRQHLIPEHLCPFGEEMGVVLFGFVDCDARLLDPHAGDAWRWYHSNVAGVRHERADSDVARRARSRCRPDGC